MSSNKAKEHAPRKIAFLDRDGVINKKALEHCYITNEQDFIFNEGVFELCSLLKNKGFEFIVVTNQRGIARGLFAEHDLHKIHDKMRKGFREEDVEVLDVFYCVHGEGECDCRKPKPGMLVNACNKYSIDLEQSILISDSKDDIAMGQAFGVGKNVYVSSDKPEEASLYLSKL